MSSRLAVFMGRERSLARIATLLMQPSTPLVVIRGAHGIGATTLAQQAVRYAGFLDPLLVQLMGEREPLLVQTLVAQALGINEVDEQPIDQLLSDVLRERRLLMILDDLAPGVFTAAIQPLVQNAPDVRFLATTSEPLEQSFPTVEIGPLQERDAINLASAVDLIGGRATRLVSYLGGWPLALALAGRYDLSNEQLSGGLSGVIEQVWQLLSPEAQRGLLTLVPLPALLTRSAANALAGSEAVDELVRSGMADLIPVDTSRSEEQLKLHPAVAVWVLDAHGGQRDVVFAAARDYLLDMTSGAYKALGRVEQDLWQARLTAEELLLTAVLRWTLERDPAAALRLVAEIWRFWWLTGKLSLGRFWLEQAISKADADDPYLGLARVGAGTLALNQRALDVASEHFEAVLQVEKRDPAVQALAHYGLGRAAVSEGNPVLARERFDAALELREEAGECWGVAGALFELGSLTIDEHAYADGVVLQEESLAMYQQLGERRGIASVVDALGWAAHNQGDEQRAAMYFSYSLDLYRELGDLRHIGQVLQRQGWLHHTHGRYPVAEAAFREAIALLRQIGDRQRLMWCYSGLGWVALSERRLDEARTSFLRELALARGLNLRPDIGNALNNLGHVALAQGDLSQAAGLFGDALDQRYEQGDVVGVAYVMERLSALLQQQGNLTRAAQMLGAATALRFSTQDVMPPPDQAYREELSAQLEQALGPEHFGALYEAGRAFSLDEAWRWARSIDR